MSGIAIPDSFAERLAVARQQLEGVLPTIGDPPPGFRPAELRSLAAAHQLIRVAIARLDDVRLVCLERPPRRRAPADRPAPAAPPKGGRKKSRTA